MGSRYWISGVQLGVLKALINALSRGVEIKDASSMEKVLDEILEKQYICERECFERLIGAIE